MQKKQLVVTVAALIASLAVSDWPAGMDKVKKAQNEEERRSAFKEVFDRLLPVTIYGKVVDQNNEPVPGADVCISWERATYMLGKPDYGRKDWIKTDGKGRFIFSCDHPHRAFASASKTGYEAPKGSTDDLIQNRTGEDTPAVIFLRKKGPQSFLIVSPSGNRGNGSIFQTDGTNAVSRPLDLLAWKSDPGWKRSVTADADLRIDAAFNADKKTWNVTYSITNGPGGIVLVDKILYEAPADGYAPSVSMSVAVTNMQGLQCYLYVKSRDPAVYSRVLFAHGIGFGTNMDLRVSCKAWVNPYGDRNLEYDERVDGVYGVSNDLEKEAKAALRSKQLPQKPDVAERVRQRRERNERERLEEERRRNSPEARRIREENERKGRAELAKARKDAQEQREKWLRDLKETEQRQRGIKQEREE
jgi:hypothetical protein